MNNINLITAMLHIKEASRLLEAVHPKLSKTLITLVNAFICTDEENLEMQKMEEVSSKIMEQSDGSAN